MLERTMLSRKVFEDIKSQAEDEMAKNLKQVELAIAPYMKRITDYPEDPQTVYAGLAGLKGATDEALVRMFRRAYELGEEDARYSAFSDVMHEIETQEE